jgi:hypothetical protein
LIERTFVVAAEVLALLRGKGATGSARGLISDGSLRAPSTAMV